jgi:ankyrin repeat protein
MDDCGSARDYEMASLVSQVPNVAICRLLDERGISNWNERTDCTFYGKFVPGFTTTPLQNMGAWRSSHVQKLTPLHHIAFQGRLEVLEYVVEHCKDVDIDTEADYGIRPLFLAIVALRNNVVRYLLKKGAKPDSIYKPTRWTMLHFAAQLGERLIVESLLEHGAGRYREISLPHSQNRFYPREMTRLSPDFCPSKC